MTSLQKFEWDDRFLLGFQPMDDMHREFVELAAALRHAEGHTLPDVLDAMIRHAREHFEQEKEWMLATFFPSTDCHVTEHDKVLASLIEVRALLESGNFRVVRELALALQDWFPGHADYMDSALAQWMVRRKFGGAPVVIRRNVMTT
jgi:hemerythrin